MRIMWTIFSKEFIDIVRDRRRFALTLLSLLLLGPFIFIAPSAFMLTRATKQTMDVLTIPVQGMERAPALIAYLADEEDVHAVAADNVETLVKDRQYPLGLIIPDDYEEKIGSGRSVELVLVIDMRRTMSVRSTRLQDALEGFGGVLMKERLTAQGLSDDYFTPLTVKPRNVATSTETAGSLLGLIIPGIIISFALSAGMPIAVSSIAGEKKNLTMEPVLFTTVSRFQLVSAKLLAVLVGVILTLVSLGIATAVMAGVALAIMARSLPMDKIASIAAKAAASSAESTLAGGYHLEPAAILLFFLAPFLIILLGAALQILVSTWARNDEEANTYLAPLSLLSGMIVMVTMFLDDYIPRLWHYGLPVFGTILSMRDLLGNKVDPASLTVMFGTSALYAFLILFLAVWMFHREEVVFRT